MGDIFGAADPVVAAAYNKNPLDPQNPTGRFYLVYLESSFTPQPSADARILLVSSDDGGVTWTAPTVVEASVGFADEHHWVDKPWIAVDIHDDFTDFTYPEQPVYVTYSSFNDAQTGAALGSFGWECDLPGPVTSGDTWPIMLEGSTDGGANFDMTPGADPMAGFEVTDVSDPARRANRGSAVSVGPYGSIYVAYMQGGCAGTTAPVPNEIRLSAIRVDALAKFTGPVRTTVGTFGHFPRLEDYCSPAATQPWTFHGYLVGESTGRDPIDPCTWDLFRVNNFPSIVASYHRPSGPPPIPFGWEWIHVTWADWQGDYSASPAPDGHADIKYSRGTVLSVSPPEINWSSPRTVNGDSTPGHDQFFPFVTEHQQSTGDTTVRIFYYDRRKDTENEQISVFMAGSTDGGSTWTHEEEVRCLGLCPNDVGFQADFFIGDYIGAASSLTASGVDFSRVVWADSRNATGVRPDNNDEIWTALSTDP
ncbi:MAG: hypothetical protein O7H41_20240 [Planctomycetota bacterium]|nr:hypothetical protein [Planctomycetota bacterium]